MEKTARTSTSRANFVAVNQSGDEAPLVLSYLGLRKAVGIIGLLLPFVLAFGKMLLQGSGIECSISSYYYTDMGNVFVGSLCVIGLFMMSCRGYDRRDAVAGCMACVFAVGVALFPTNRCGEASSGISYLHWTCAALLFLTLAYFCLVLFIKTAPDRHPTRQKGQRNTVYRACGVAILAALLLIALNEKVAAVESLLAPYRPVFWLESIAVVAFGVAWLTKGEWILKDQDA